MAPEASVSPAGCGRSFFEALTWDAVAQLYRVHPAMFREYAVRVGKVGADVEPSHVVACALEALGRSGAERLFASRRGLEPTVLRFEELARIQDPNRPHMRRSQLALQLAAAAANAERGRRLLLDGGWVVAPGIHPWLYSRVGACLPLDIEKALTEVPSRWGPDCKLYDFGVAYEDATREVAQERLRYELQHHAHPIRWRVDPANPDLDHARETLATLGTELVARLAEDAANGKDRAEAHLRDLLLGARRGAGWGPSLAFAAAIEGKLQGTSPTTFVGEITHPGPRALVSVAAHVSAELATGAHEACAELLESAAVGASLGGLAFVRERQSRALHRQLDDLATRRRAWLRMATRFVTTIGPIWRSARNGGRAKSRVRRAARALRSQLHEVSQLTPYEVPAGTKWHQIEIVVTGDPEQLLVRLGGRLLAPMSPARLGLLDLRKRHGAAKPTWVFLLSFLAVRLGPHRGRAPSPDQRDKVRKRMSAIRRALHDAFPAIPASDDPIPFRPREGWVPEFRVVDGR